MTSHYAFRLLSDYMQFALVFKEGNFLATRWEDEHEAVQLYHMPANFFVEVSYDVQSNAVSCLRIFTTAALLEDYTLKRALGLRQSLRTICPHSHHR